MNLKQNSFSEQSYIGRFAPSPSGLLHFGSLLSALASYLDAKANKGTWLVRIDDIDPPREQTGATESILKSLEAFGLHWDNSVIYQSARFPSYISACIELIKNDLAYPCICSRKSLSEYDQYPGFCQKLLSAQEKTRLIDSLSRLKEQVFQPNHLPALQTILKNYSLRIRSHDFDLNTLNFEDRIQSSQQVPNNFGDFIILRKDSLPSYMLACGLDDIDDKITHIVRGSDLLESTFWQRYLQMQMLNLQQQKNTLSIHYAHLPLVVNDLQQKFSKQHHSPEIDPKNKSSLLYLALVALGQAPDTQLQYEDTTKLLEWAIQHWRLNRIPTQNIPFDSLNS